MISNLHPAVFPKRMFVTHKIHKEPNMRPVSEVASESWANSLDIVTKTVQEPVAIAIIAGIAIAAYMIFFRK